jgi:pimeloyl-ACP methyl ester carboxylesterase
MAMRTAVAVLVAAVARRPADARADAGPPAHLTVVVDGHPMAVWSRAPKHPKGVIVLLHGRTWSSLPDFDLQVPGDRRSVMEALAARGYAVYALDARGYGSTPRDSTGWLTPDRAEADVVGVLRFIGARHDALPKPVLIGWSFGSLVAQLTVERQPDLVSAVVLYGYPADPAALPAPTAGPAVAPRIANTAAAAASDFIAPNVTPKRVVDAYVAAALAADPVRVDWRGLEQFQELIPEQVRVPTLLLQGELDPLAPTPALARLFTRLGTGDRRWVVLAGRDHAALLEDPTPEFVSAITDFIERRTR